MNDLIDVTKERIKSPYFGYCFLSFIFINWRAFYILIKTKGLPLERLSAFDEATNNFNLFFWPFVFGGVVFLVRPWLEFLSEFISSKPSSLVMYMKLRNENNIIIRKSELEAARINLIDNKERSLIERAKRDGEIDMIEDEELRKEVKRKVGIVRIEGGGVDEYFKENSMACFVLGLIAKNGNGVVKSMSVENEDGEYLEFNFGEVTVNHKNRYRFLQVEDVLNNLVERELLKISNAQPWIMELTLAGWDKAKELGLLASG